MSSICAVNALKEIAEQLGKSDWDFNLNPCDGNSNWTTPKRKDLPVYNNTRAGVHELRKTCDSSAKFVSFAKNWGTSTTGQFLDRAGTIDDYTAKNVSVLRMNDSELYTRARLSPLSLTYYACCLANGNYIVTLHFAEIIFRDNRSYHNLGRRVFDVYIQGLLLDGTTIAVKQVSLKSKQGSREFVNEIGMISGLRTPNSCKKASTYCWCTSTWRITASSMLYSVKRDRLHIWIGLPDRICIGIAKGLVYLHKESPLKIVHRDTKATNILLDSDLNAKTSDSVWPSLMKSKMPTLALELLEQGYMAPEYALWGYLTYKPDVYSFGVVALEIVAGMNNLKDRPGSLLELLDPRLASSFNQEEAIRMIKVALLCTNPSPALRPIMSAVVGMLQGHISVQKLNVDPSIYGDDLMLQSLRDKHNVMRPDNSIEIEALV
ncbi:hypothetical protein RJ640_012717 [Escallonia rubra]|uniref:non-specific serine/threonine protein kinase n=1 Tax=Escallonia rubra TaxID=112253 RepID=A0AA88UNJ2_9ASTE|nr:hypothetical protein RJ640_012717 [Escallonia rubra]